MAYTLAYDSGCGPCTTFKNVIEFLDARHDLEYLGLAEADRLGLLDGVGPSLRHRSFHLVSPSGGVLSGAHALPTLVGLLPGGMPASFFLARNGLAFRAASFVYATFSRLHDSGSCSYVPAGERRDSAKKTQDVETNPMVALGLTL